MQNHFPMCLHNLMPLLDNQTEQTIPESIHMQNMGANSIPLPAGIRP
jgi:hypothetical protein